MRGYGLRFWDFVKDVKKFEVIACFHPDIAVANAASVRMNCTATNDYGLLIDSGEIDAVVLTVPNHLHFGLSKNALEKGKHVFVEKPLTNTYKEGEELKAIAHRKELVLMVGHNYRKNGYIEAIKSVVESGRLGKIVAAEFNMSHGGGLKFGPDQWRYHIEKCPGGPLNMLGSHLIDTANYLFGQPINVFGSVKNCYANTTAEDVSLIQLEYKSGAVVNITNLYNSVSTEFINVYGTEGAVRYCKWPNEVLWFQPKDCGTECSVYEKIEFTKLNSQENIFQDFVDAIIDGNRELVNTTCALKTVQVMEAARKSFADGVVICI